MRTAGERSGGNRTNYPARVLAAAVLVGAAAACGCSVMQPGASSLSVAPGDMARAGTVDERYQSYNVEMVEVTGGRFRKPYKEINAILDAKASKQGSDGAGVPAGTPPSLYQQRAPIDLSNARLRKLAAALGPAYMRVSGTWANNTYFHDSAQPAPKTPPKGFGGVLTREEWKGVIDFARATDARLVTSFATGVGVRDGKGVWTPDQARRFVDYTKSAGGSIAAAEFMNEPTFATIGGAPKGYDAAAFARDLKVFVPFLKQASPETVILGPGSVGEGVSLAPPGAIGTMLNSEDLLKAAGPVFEAFSYHAYPAVSKRCASMGPAAQTAPEATLSEDFLLRADRIEQFYAGLRDRFEPGKPLWLTETADAACGGNPWASTFLDSFRYLDQLGRLAKRGVQVHMHNTLAASDYGLLEEDTFTPRPNYWAALLWRKLMGPTVLEPGIAAPAALHVYAHCLRGQAGGVALLAINTDRASSYSIAIPRPADRYTLSAGQLEDGAVQLNGTVLKLGESDTIPALAAAKAAAGEVTLAPATITFLAMADANNRSCR